MKIIQIAVLSEDPRNRLPRESVYKIEQTLKNDPTAEILCFKKAWDDYKSGSNKNLSVLRGRLHELDMALDLTLHFAEGALTAMGEKLLTDRR